MAPRRNKAQLVSARGTVESESRTNMLIIKDLPQNIAEMQTLLAELDRPEPQVEIEAKILRTNRDTAKALGIKSYPTVVVAHEGAGSLRETARIVGYFPVKPFLSKLDRGLASWKKVDGRVRRSAPRRSRD